MINDNKPLTLKEIENIFKDDNEDLSINRINRQNNPKPRTRNFYQKPTSPNLQFEERSQIVQSKYYGDDIYEWNIDGVNEHQILNILQEMIIASTAYKSKGNSNHSIAKHLTVGFTGQLKGWWDNSLSKWDKIIMLTAMRDYGTLDGTQCGTYTCNNQTLPWITNNFPRNNF